MADSAQDTGKEIELEVVDVQDDDKLTKEQSTQTDEAEKKKMATACNIQNAKKTAGCCRRIFKFFWKQCHEDGEDGSSLFCCCGDNDEE